MTKLFKVKAKPTMKPVKIVKKDMVLKTSKKAKTRTKVMKSTGSMKTRTKVMKSTWSMKSPKGKSS